MGRSVICDEKLIEILESISSEGFTPGLILGQFAGQKDYVVHLPMTPKPPPQGEGDVESLRSHFLKVEDIDENLMSQHARTVTRMLSGGMWILGFYVVGPGDIFGNKNALNKLRSIANTIHNCTKGNDYLCGKDPSNQKLILHFSSLSKKFVCKCLDMTSLGSSIRPADWKFKPNVTTWLRVESTVNLSWLPPFTIPISTQTTKKKFQECLLKFQKHMESLVYNINGLFCPGDQTLLSLNGNKSAAEELDEEGHTFQMMFYEISKPEEPLPTEKKDKSSEIQLCGVLGSRVFIHEKSTAEDAVKAVREDLLRTLASRLEMHWQTFEESEGKSRIRCLPRRVFFTPENSEVSFSEYLFEGEVEDDAIASISEHLGLFNGTTDILENVWEIPNPEESNIGQSDDDIDGISANIKKVGKESKMDLFSNKALLFGLVTASITLLLSIFIHFSNS